MQDLPMFLHVFGGSAQCPHVNTSLSTKYSTPVTNIAGDLSIYELCKGGIGMVMEFDIYIQNDKVSA